MENRHTDYQAMCVSDGKLVEYKEKSLPGEEADAVSSHLTLCDACLMRLEMLPESTAEYERRLEALDDVRPTPVPTSLQQALANFKVRAEAARGRKLSLEEVLGRGGLRAGQLWRPQSKDIIIPVHWLEEHCSVFDLGSKPCYVVITGTEEEEIGGYHVIRVAVVSTDMDVAQTGHGDVLVDENELLAHPFVIQGWNQAEMLRENLEYCVGSVEQLLSGEEYERLIEGSQSELPDRVHSFEAVVRRGEYSDSLARYRARAYEESAYLRIPVEALREWADDESSEWVGVNPEVERVMQGFASAVLQTGFASRGVGLMSDHPEENVKTFAIKGTKLKGAASRDADGMWLRIQTDDNAWDGAVITFTWEPYSAAVARRRFVVLTRDDISFDAYVAEINLGEPDEFDLRPTVVPLPLSSLTAQMAGDIQKSIVDARTPRDLRAWRRLAEEGSLPAQLRDVIVEAVNARSLK